MIGSHFSQEEVLATVDAAISPSNGIAKSQLSDNDHETTVIKGQGYRHITKCM